MRVYEDVSSAHRELRKGHRQEDLDAVLKKLPSAVRRMGLVRCLEWLHVAKHRSLGQDLLERLALILMLPPDLQRAVDHLETCPRRELFWHHTRAIEVFDVLATIHRIPEST